MHFYLERPVSSLSALSLSSWEPGNRTSDISRCDTVSDTPLHAKTTQGCPLLLASHRSSSIRKDVKAVFNETEICLGLSSSLLD